MFYSHCLLSKKGSLGTIWVAAHCHKRLKKDQVTQTNISSSVDKILLDEVPVVTYRILGYLLLGVVRIYSKKVEYLFHDCRDVVIKINDFPVRKRRKNVHMEAMVAPYSSITLPERFELDSFDLEILEDVSGGNVRPSEDIMLKDLRENERVGHHSFDKYQYEEDAAHVETSSTDYTPVKDVCSPHLMVRDTVDDPSHNSSYLVESIEKLRGERFSLEECLQPVILGEADKEPGLVRTFGDDQHHTVVEQIKFLDTEMFFGVEEETPYLIRSVDEEQHVNSEQTKFQRITSPINVRDNITINVAHESKFPEVSGAATPEFMVVRTPATREGVRRSKKRKCFFDDIIVLSNEILKQQIDNSSDLVCKRRKAPHTSLHAWKASRISNLPRSSLEPLFTGLSLELRSLFLKKELRTSEEVETVETCEILDVIETPTFHTFSTTVVEAPEHLDIPRSPLNHRFPDQSDITPSTPVTHSTSPRLHDVPEISNSDKVGLARSFESLQEGLFLTEDQEFDFSLLNEMNSCEGDEQEMDGWSVRTRAVAKYLHRNVLNEKKQRGNEAVNLLQVLEGKTRKESARLCYEILVLSSGGYIDVKQDNAYGDIFVHETSKLKQSCEVDDGVYAQLGSENCEQY